MPGTVIRQYREERNYSQKWVASQMNISQNAYSKIENNLTQLTVHHIKRLSKILEVSELDLLQDEFEIHKPVSLPTRVSKNELLDHLNNLKMLVQQKNTIDHDRYRMMLSLIIEAENTISEVH